MARYKTIDRSPKFLPVVLDAQIMAGSFEYALDYLIDNEIDLSPFDTRYKNDDTGAPAYAPAVMLKIILLAYSYVGRVQPAPLSFKTSVRLAPALLNTGIYPSDWVNGGETILGCDNESMRRNTPAAIDALRLWILTLGRRLSVRLKHVDSPTRHLKKTGVFPRP